MEMEARIASLSGPLRKIWRVEHHEVVHSVTKGYIRIEVSGSDKYGRVGDKLRQFLTGGHPTFSTPQDGGSIIIRFEDAQRVWSS